LQLADFNPVRFGGREHAVPPRARNPAQADRRRPDPGWPGGVADSGDDGGRAGTNRNLYLSAHALVLDELRVGNLLAHMGRRSAMCVMQAP